MDCQKLTEEMSDEAYCLFAAIENTGCFVNICTVPVSHEGYRDTKQTIVTSICEDDDY